MNFSEHILSSLSWLPMLGGIALLAIGDGGDFRSPRAVAMRWVALAVSLLVLACSIALYVSFDSTSAAMQFVEHVPWIAALDAYYFPGVDGRWVPLIILTRLFTPLVIIGGGDTVDL